MVVAELGSGNRKGPPPFQIAGLLVLGLGLSSSVCHLLGVLLLSLLLSGRECVSVRL